MEGIWLIDCVGVSVNVFSVEIAVSGTSLLLLLKMKMFAGFIVEVSLASGCVTAMCKEDIVDDAVFVSSL